MIHIVQGTTYLLIKIENVYRIIQNPVSGWIVMMRSLNEYAARMRDLAEIQLRDLINLDPPSHWVLFLSCDVFLNIFPLKVFVYFRLKYYGLFLYSERNNNIIT